MNDIQLELDSHRRGKFHLTEGGETLAKLEVAVIKDNLVAYHTEVSPKLRGQGVARKLLDSLVGYAQNNGLKIVPLCPYVLAEFKRRPEQYESIWNKNWHNPS